MSLAFTEPFPASRRQLLHNHAATEARHLVAKPVLLYRLTFRHQPARRRAEQAKSEDRPAMGIHPAGGLQHIVLTGHPYRAQHHQYMLRRDRRSIVAHDEKFLHPRSHHRGAGLKRGQIHIPVRASVTNIHQPGLWGQANFGQQRALYRADHLFGTQWLHAPHTRRIN